MVLKLKGVLNVMKIENISTTGWQEAIRGMRNPFNSHILSDSRWGSTGYKVGTNDFNLMLRLSKLGSDHAKFLRMIVIYADINAPLYWWKQMDQYKIGTVTNSYSTMHTIHKKPFEHKDFNGVHITDTIIEELNFYRDRYNQTQDKYYWYGMIELLPSSYNQKRRWMGNYQVLKNIYHSRKNHKLQEWHNFCSFIKTLPHSKIITL